MALEKMTLGSLTLNRIGIVFPMRPFVAIQFTLNFPVVKFVERKDARENADGALCSACFTSWSFSFLR